MTSARHLIILILVVANVQTDARAQAADRPNILWISCEDISPHLKCYGDTTAMTPNLDRLASEGTRFTRAYSCHGVCAPSRTGIITGMYPIALGANHMRSKVRLREHVQLFPQLLREAGYYCTNNSKTDYNVVRNLKSVWDASSDDAHWKNRTAPDQPFFAVFNLTMTHESKVWPQGWASVVTPLLEAERHDPSAMSVPPLYPDTAAVRGDLARLADLITVMDRRAGAILSELEQSGLADNTIVMFWSDHGNGLPRAKRWTYESGSLVPLIIRVPDSLRAKADFGAPGSVDTRMVQLIDLGPTVLSMAGIETPDHMHGRALQGPERTSGCPLIYGARDRIDERMDLVRTVRDDRFRYVRNLMPWRAALQPVTYAEQNETLKSMRQLLADGMLPAASAQWFKTPRESEELYDVNADPWELDNLARRPEYEQDLERLREACNQWQCEIRDVHLIPEHLLAEEERDRTRAEILAGESGLHRTQRLLAAALQASRLDATAAGSVGELLSDDAAERWWQVTLIAEAPDAASRLEVLRREAAHPHVAIRIAAAGGLVHAGVPEEAVAILAAALRESDESVRHAAMLQVDESGSELIAQLLPEIRAAGQSEYIQRLVQHALAQTPE